MKPFLKLSFMELAIIGSVAIAILVLGNLSIPGLGGYVCITWAVWPAILFARAGIPFSILLCIISVLAMNLLMAPVFQKYLAEFRKKAAISIVAFILYTSGGAFAYYFFFISALPDNPRNERYDEGYRIGMVLHSQGASYSISPGSDKSEGYNAGKDRGNLIYQRLFATSNIMSGLFKKKNKSESLEIKEITR